METWNRQELLDMGIDMEFRSGQSFDVRSDRDIARPSFQSPPRSQDKLVRCTKALFSM